MLIDKDLLKLKLQEFYTKKKKNQNINTLRLLMYEFSDDTYCELEKDYAYINITIPTMVDSISDEIVKKIDKEVKNALKEFLSYLMKDKVHILSEYSGVEFSGSNEADKPSLVFTCEAYTNKGKRKKDKLLSFLFDVIIKDYKLWYNSQKEAKNSDLDNLKQYYTVEKTIPSGKIIPSNIKIFAKSNKECLLNQKLGVFNFKMFKATENGCSRYKHYGIKKFLWIDVKCKLPKGESIPLSYKLNENEIISNPNIKAILDKLRKEGLINKRNIPKARLDTIKKRIKAMVGNTKTCAICGRKFVPKFDTQITCGKCKQKKKNILYMIKAREGYKDSDYFDLETMKWKVTKEELIADLKKRSRIRVKDWDTLVNSLMEQAERYWKEE